MSEEQNKNREKREFERGNNFDVFVSYRRSDGKSFARTLNLAFKNEGFRCFLDYDKLEGGDFSRQLQDAVVDAPIFVMVMTPDYFARCVKKVETADGKTVFEPNEDDWVRREIELALSNGKIIIPIDVNGMLNGTPDYLDKDFGNRVGCHQFSPVYDNNAFEATFGAMLDKNIWNIFYKFQKPTNKAEITVATDADCKLMKNNKLLATLQAGEHSLVLLGKGNHLLQARSEEFPEIFIEIEKEIEDVSCDDFIRIKLKDKLPKKPVEPVEPPKPEPPQPNVVTPTPTIVPQVPKVESVSPSDFRLLRNLEGHSDMVNSLRWSPDGKYLASGSGDFTVVLWDVKSGKRLKTLEGESSYVESICWSPDGKYLASGYDDGCICVFALENGEEICYLDEHSEEVKSISWSPDGRYLASSSFERNGNIWEGKIIIWDTNGYKIFKNLDGHTEGINSVSWSPDGKYLASSSFDNTVVIWDVKSGKRLKTLEGNSDYLYSVSWSPDGRYLSCGSNNKTVIIWDVNSGTEFRKFEGHSYSVESICWSPDGRYLASGSYKGSLFSTRGEIIIWDVNSDTVVRILSGDSKGVKSIYWSPDGKYLASSSRDNNIRIWGVE